jgi:hypothetical protein
MRLGWVRQSKAEAPNMAGALERTRDDQYHLYDVEGLGSEVTKASRVRAPK